MSFSNTTKYLQGLKMREFSEWGKKTKVMAGEPGDGEGGGAGGLRVVSRVKSGVMENEDGEALNKT